MKWLPAWDCGVCVVLLWRASTWAEAWASLLLSNSQRRKATGSLSTGSSPQHRNVGRNTRQGLYGQLYRRSSWARRTCWGQSKCEFGLSLVNFERCKARMDRDFVSGRPSPQKKSTFGYEKAFNETEKLLLLQSGHKTSLFLLSAAATAAAHK